MVTGIIGRKAGMTQIFDADGTVHPATVIKAGPCVVVQAKNAQTDGYESVQLGLVEDKPAKVARPLAGHYKKANVPPTRVRREVKLAPGGDALKAGDPVLVSIFASGERVDADNHLLIVEGGIPGAPSGYVVVRKAVAAKKIKVAQVEKPKKGKK